MRTKILQAPLTLLMFAFTVSPASAQVLGTYNETIPAGTGTLSYTVTDERVPCTVGGKAGTAVYLSAHYSSFSYTASGVTVPLSGSVTSVYDGEGIGTCPADSFPSVTLTGGGVEVAFTPSGSTGGSAVYGGFINPKYLIASVMYAPPGTKSTVSYGKNTVVGNSTSVTSSFSSTVGESVAISESGGIPGFLSAKITTTESESYTEEQDSSSSIAVNQTTSNSTGLSGYSDPVNGINHDYDYIFVWLNPIVTFTISSASGKTQVQWTGYGYDLDDTPAYPDMDVLGVQLGCLNGDFYQQYTAGTNTNWNTCLDVFNNNNANGQNNGFWRGWALDNADDTPPYLTPLVANASAPYDFCSSTYKGTDLWNICQADPFGANPNYTVQFNPGSSTTTDGRFTACGNSLCYTTIQYEPDVNNSYSQGYSTTVTGSETAKYTYTSGYSVESSFTGGSASFGETIGATFTSTYSFSSTEQFSQATNSQNGQTASFSIVGPAEGYTGPLQFVVYQDDLYGTFMFYPD